MSGSITKDNSTTAIPGAWEMRFLVNRTSDTWFYTDDITVTDAWLRVYPDDVEITPFCRVPPRQHSREQHIGELRTTLARILHMHRMMLEATYYRESVTDAHCIHKMHEVPLRALNVLARYPHKKDEV